MGSRLEATKIHYKAQDKLIRYAKKTRYVKSSNIYKNTNNQEKEGSARSRAIP